MTISGCSGLPQGRRQQIVESARTIIEKDGPEALTDQAVPQGGNVGLNAYQVLSLPELDWSDARSIMRALLTSGGDEAVSGTPLNVIREAVAAYVVWADDHPDRYRLAVHRGVSALAAGCDEGCSGGLAEDVVALGERSFPGFARDQEAAEAIVVGVAGLVTESVLRWLGKRDEPREQLIDRLTALAWLIVDHHLHGLGVGLDPAATLPARACGR